MDVLLEYSTTSSLGLTAKIPASQLGKSWGAAPGAEHFEGKGGVAAYATGAVALSGLPATRSQSRVQKAARCPSPPQAPLLFIILQVASPTYPSPSTNHTGSYGLFLREAAAT